MTARRAARHHQAHGVLPDQLAHGMRLAAGFRNVLVHDYLQVDDPIVLDRLADPSDL